MEHIVKDFGYNLETNQVVMTIDEVVYTIPSEYFPLDDEARRKAFCFDNTSSFRNKAIYEVFNASGYEIGRCYSNAYKLYKNLINKGVSKHHLKMYVGWLILFGNVPIHHSWLVYKNKHILDLTPILSEHEYVKFMGKYKNITDTRKAVALMYKQILSNPYAKAGVFGKVKDCCMYIGNECDSLKGIEMYNQLIKKYPTHIIHDNVYRNGLTETQKLVIESLSKSEG